MGLGNADLSLDRDNNDSNSSSLLSYSSDSSKSDRIDCPDDIDEIALFEKEDGKEYERKYVLDEKYGHWDDFFGF